MLTHARLLQILSYDPLTGDFRRLVKRSRCAVGGIAGSTNRRGVWRIGIDGKSYQAHRLAWFYMTGDWPVALIDHRDVDHTNNRFSNLREATPSQNTANQIRGRSRKSGLKGVVLHKTGRWQAQVKCNGRMHYLGLFDDVSIAHAAYREAAKRLHGEFARFE